MHAPAPSGRPAGRVPAGRPPAGLASRIGGATCFAARTAAIELSAERGVSPVEMLFTRTAFSAPVILGWAPAEPGLRIVRSRRPAAHMGAPRPASDR